MSQRKHHCRACGVLVCDSCSSKKLQLDLLSSSSAGQRRVCDGCFNRLIFSSSEHCTGTAPDHFKIFNLKESTIHLIQSLQDFVETLDGDGSEEDDDDEQNEQLMEQNHRKSDIFDPSATSATSHIRRSRSRPQQISKSTSMGLRASISSSKERASLIKDLESIFGNGSTAASASAVGVEGGVVGRRSVAGNSSQRLALESFISNRLDALAKCQESAVKFSEVSRGVVHLLTRHFGRGSCVFLIHVFCIRLY